MEVFEGAELESFAVQYDGGCVSGQQISEVVEVDLGDRSLGQRRRRVSGLAAQVAEDRQPDGRLRVAPAGGAPGAEGEVEAHGLAHYEPERNGQAMTSAKIGPTRSQLRPRVLASAGRPGVQQAMASPAVDPGRCP